MPDGTGSTSGGRCNGSPKRSIPQNSSAWSWPPVTPRSSSVGIREHTEGAQVRQVRTIPAPRSTPAAALVTLRAELDLARQESRQLRAERDQLQGALQHQFGQQLDTLHTPELTTPTDSLTRHSDQLARRLEEATVENTSLQARISSLEDDLTAARFLGSRTHHMTGLTPEQRAEAEEVIRGPYRFRPGVDYADAPGRVVPPPDHKPWTLAFAVPQDASYALGGA
ncbi:hypothetical protein [Streptomyces sp. NPDC006193]|uniref:hypothetical protein n=1 Tax=Streptomyces sp. NPDC006193 TaxID=3155717 RepID=UPI0033ACC893